MKIMTFNTQHCLNYISKTIDYEVMAKAIIQCGADIVGLNEMRGKGISPDYDRQVEILSELSGLSYFYFAKAIDVNGVNPYGNGLLSRYPILHTETIRIPDPIERKCDHHYESRCILKAKLTDDITVLVTHFGLNPDEQQNAVSTVLKHLEERKCILMGDFNLRPDHKLLEPIRMRMKDTADCFSEPLLSFPSDHPNRKIDYLFVSRDIEVVEADIPCIIASDHRPHTATVHF